MLPSWLKEKENTIRDQNTWEEERSWRDGAAHKVRQAVDEWLDDTLERKAIILVSRPVPIYSSYSFSSVHRSKSLWTGSTLHRTRFSC